MTKVVFIARPDLYEQPGGDTVQVDGTAKYLRRLDVEVDIKLAGQQVNYAAYDLVHFFNIIDCEDLLGHAMKCRIPYVISTIYVDYREYDRNHRQDFLGMLSRWLSRDTIEFIKTLGKCILKGERVSTWKYFIKGHRGSILYLIRNAACLLPNSHNEYRRLSADYSSSKAYFAIPNAIDPEVFSLEAVPQVTRDLVLCAARIEGRKNQINLIRAMRGLGIKLVLAGAASHNQAGYEQRCRQEANEDVTFAGKVGSQELLRLYAAARVHAMPSWFETTGLSSLEAAAMGCNIVVADRGDVREYFQHRAFYCDPADPDSIRKAILEAYNTPYDPAMRTHILENYTWEKTAIHTLEAYKHILKERMQ